jgi:hypothetical protein
MAAEYKDILITNYGVESVHPDNSAKPFFKTVFESLINSKTKKRKVLQESETLKFIFKSKADKENSKVNGICLVGIRARVRDPIILPIQCFQCWRFGHVSIHCHMKCLTCKRCGGDHLLKKCKCENVVCVNCQKSHYADSHDCEMHKKATEIAKIKLIKDCM